MEEGLPLTTLDSPSCPVGTRMDSFIDSRDSSGLDITRTEASSLSHGLDMLETGEADVLALPAILVHGNMMSILQAGCKVVGARTPIRPYRILVSDNKIQYQPKSAILLCDNKLIRRQLHCPILFDFLVSLKIQVSTRLTAWTALEVRSGVFDNADRGRILSKLAVEQ